MSLKALTLAVTAVFASITSASADRGSDGQVNILFWQAPSLLNPYLSGGVKEIEAASLIIEPLARYDDTGAMVPWLVEDIPTLENGGVASDMTSITWVLREGLAWSDGTPLTSEDVRFTWAYCTADGGGCAQREKFKGIADIETPDDRTVLIRFDGPKPFPYDAFVGATAPIIQAAQFANCLGARAPECTDANFAPIGTGPFVVDDFRPNDVAVLEANANYRDPAKPAFARVILKGGGDAAAAGRAVLETGEFDYAWNLQLAPEVLTRMESAGKGQVVSAFGNLVERIILNMTDPSPDRGEARSTMAAPHPFLSDISVRQALSMAIDRALLVEIGYGATGQTTCNILNAPAQYGSDANDGCLTQDIQGAQELLDSAGWTDSDGNGVRDKDGQELRIIFQTSTNAVRQDFQAMIKQWWSEIGVETELRNINASVFFGADPGSPDTYQKFFADVQMFAGTFDGTDPEAYMAGWQCDRIPSPDNQWQGSNIARFCSEDFDAMAAEMARTGALDKRADIAKLMNDVLMQKFILLPLVDRGRISAHANSLGGVAINAWDSELWNIADWHRAQ
ncbi:MAG: peptide ABC transporter substrate-binding protein [Pseudomonadota bacterium]